MSERGLRSHASLMAATAPARFDLLGPLAFRGLRPKVRSDPAAAAHAAAPWTFVPNKAVARGVILACCDVEIAINPKGWREGLRSTSLFCG